MVFDDVVGKCQLSFSPAEGHIGVAPTTISQFGSRGVVLGYGSQLVHHTTRALSAQLCKKDCQVN